MEGPSIEVDVLIRLVKAAKETVDAISLDDNGAMIGGKWMGGNGGLLSPKTLEKADALRRAVSALEAQIGEQKYG